MEVFLYILLAILAVPYAVGYFRFRKFCKKLGDHLGEPVPDEDVEQLEKLTKRMKLLSFLIIGILLFKIFAVDLLRLFGG